MNNATNKQTTMLGQESKETHLNELFKLLDALEPNEKKKKDDAFSDAYISIANAIARKVPQRAILKALEAGGLKLHPARFKQRFIEESQKRNKNGERIHCQHCNQAFEPMGELNLMADTLAHGSISTEQKVDA